MYYLRFIFANLKKPLMMMKNLIILLIYFEEIIYYEKIYLPYEKQFICCIIKIIIKIMTSIDKQKTTYTHYVRFLVVVHIIMFELMRHYLIMWTYSLLKYMKIMKKNLMILFINIVWNLSKKTMFEY